MSSYLEKPTDTELITRCIAGEERAWNDLIDRHRHRLLVSLRYLLGRDGRDGHLVEDIFQDTMLALVQNRFKRLRLYNRSQSSFTTFVKTIAKQIIAQRRRQCYRGDWTSLGDRAPADPARHDGFVRAELQELIEALTPQESRYLKSILLSDSPSASFPISPANEWFLRHRLTIKWKDHFGAQ